jgi:hypothetical protein
MDKLQKLLNALDERVEHTKKEFDLETEQIESGLYERPEVDQAEWDYREAKKIRAWVLSVIA